MTGFTAEFVEQFFDYVVQLGVTKPVSLVQNDDTQEVLIYDNHIVIGLDESTQITDCIELVARARLAETRPLLGVFFFQKEYTDQEGRYMQSLARVCGPLQKAWTYRILREHAPALYDREINELFHDYADIMSTIKYASLSEDFMVLELFAILKESPFHDVDIDASKSDPSWQTYIEKLIELIPAAPDPYLYLDLIAATNPPYLPRILTENGVEFFDVREK
jgi:hypothetical protein